MKRLCTWRTSWNRGRIGDGSGGKSNEVSVGLVWEPRDIWIGLYWTCEDEGWFAYVCLIPCLPIRIHRKWSFGGIFPPRSLTGAGR